MGFAITRTAAVTNISKRIRLKEQDLALAEQIFNSNRVSPVTSRVLAARGFSDNSALKNFLEPTLKDGLPDPWLLKGLEEACEILVAAHKQKQAVAICCDFDVDGLSGGALVQDFFKRVGIRSQVFVPDRFTDGYGLGLKAVDRAAELGFSILLTVDYGTTNSAELVHARRRGLKTIVVDHHHVGDHKPGADVFINPNRTDCGFAGRTLCAAGLAWYLIIGLRQRLALTDLDVRTYLDIACLGTICDMVPLIGANRVIAKRGLETLSVSSRPGLQALKEVMGAKGIVGCSEVGFGIGPRINAAGRIVHGETVIELLTTADPKRARQIADQLNQLNAERQEIEQRVKQQALALVEDSGGAGSAIVVGEKDFHTGVIGIVAQRLVEAYYRPAVVLGGDTDTTYKGSVRGIKGFNVVKALSECGEFLIKFGGHEGAGGLSIEESKISEFRDAFQKASERQLEKLETTPFVEADTEATLPEISLAVVEELKTLAPFGMGNPAPQLLVRKLRVKELRDIKSTHLKVVLSDGRRVINGMLWRQSSHPALKLNGLVDVVFKAEASTFQGKTELLANLQAVELAI